MKGTQEKGITLIALVVTIIVLIILAGVSINLVLGDNGIITKAKEASKEQEIAQIKEKIQLEIMAKQSSNYGNLTGSDLENLLKTKGTLTDEENILERTLITTEGEYQIKVSEIYNGKIGNISSSETTYEYLKISSNGNVYFNKERYKNNEDEWNTTLLAQDGLSNNASIIIPSSIDSITVTSIDGFDCLYEIVPEYIQTITLPSTVTHIGKGAFESLDNLIINMPNTIQYIGKNAFYDAIGQTFNYAGTISQLKSITFERISNYCNRTIHCSDGDYIFPSRDDMEIKLNKLGMDFNECTTTINSLESI